jgi:hypothetical protein
MVWEVTVALLVKVLEELKLLVEMVGLIVVLEVMEVVVLWVKEEIQVFLHFQGTRELEEEDIMAVEQEVLMVTEEEVHHI